MNMVSIIMPVYNRKNFISEAINSVLAQTFSDWELIIIDDGSTDGTGEAIKIFLNDQRIKYYKQENSGVVKTRNNGVKKARGEYVAFLDSDDLWLPEKLWKQVSVISNSIEPVFLCTNFRNIDEKNNISEKSFFNKAQAHDGWVGKDLLEANFILTSSVLMPRQIFSDLGGFDETLDMKVGEDHEFWLRTAGSIKLICLKEPLTYYRIHGGQTTKNRLKNYSNALRLYFHIFFNIKKYGEIKKTDVMCGFFKRLKRILRERQA